MSSPGGNASESPDLMDESLIRQTIEVMSPVSKHLVLRLQTLLSENVVKAPGTGPTVCQIALTRNEADILIQFLTDANIEDPRHRGRLGKLIDRWRLFQRFNNLGEVSP